MGNVATLSASLIAGPQSVGDCSFPAGTFNVSFATSPNPLPAAVSAAHAKAINSPNAYVTLDGVGTNQSVTQGVFLYLRSASPMKVRLTIQDTPADQLSVVYVQGPMLIELPSTNYLKLLEAQGVGSLEYYVCGNQ